MTLSIYKNVWHLLKRYPGSYIPGPHIFYCSNLKIEEEEKWGSFYPFSPLVLKVKILYKDVGRLLKISGGGI